jgi:RHS repeat-associated protein
MIGEPRPAVRRANRQSSIRNHQSQAVYEYDVYGQPAAADPGHPNPFAFTGRRFDPETGLYYYRARYYNPTIGRFLQTDPIGYADGLNWYAYCGNNPIAFKDPTGLFQLIFGGTNCEFEEKVREVMARLREILVWRIKEIDDAISIMGCNQDHEPENCPMIFDLSCLQTLFRSMVSGIDGDEPLGILLWELPPEIAAAYTPAEGEELPGPAQGQAPMATEYRTIWFNSLYYSSPTYEKDCVWAKTMLHELAHYFGLDDSYHVPDETILGFCTADRIEEFALTNVGLGNTAGWIELRQFFECVEKKPCICPPNGRHRFCPTHGAG